MGGGPEVNIQQPAPPPAPSVTSSIQDYIQNVPSLYQVAQQYQPQFAALQQQIARQETPITAGFQEQLAAEAQQRMTEPVPEELQDEFKRNFRAQLGANAASPIGAATLSRALIGQREARQAEGRQLALALAGRQQIVQPPSQQEILGGFNTGQALGFNQSVYGTQGSIYGTQSNLAAQQAQLSQQRAIANQQFMGDIIGGSIGALGFMGGSYLGK